MQQSRELQHNASIPIHGYERNWAHASLSASAAAAAASKQHTKHHTQHTTHNDCKVSQSKQKSPSFTSELFKITSGGQ